MVPHARIQPNKSPVLLQGKVSDWEPYTGCFWQPYLLSSRVIWCWCVTYLLFWAWARPHWHKGGSYPRDTSKGDWPVAEEVRELCVYSIQSNCWDQVAVFWEVMQPRAPGSAAQFAHWSVDGNQSWGTPWLLRKNRRLSRFVRWIKVPCLRIFHWGYHGVWKHNLQGW